MYGDSATLTLPDSLYDALGSIIDVVKENVTQTAESRHTEEYHNNLTDYHDDVSFIPKFNDSQRSDYSKIGESLMEGMASVFIERWEQYQDSEDYYKTDTETAEKIAPIVNVSVATDPQLAEEKEESDSPLGGIPAVVLAPLITLFAGIQAGTSAWGQIIESISLLPALITEMGGFKNFITRPFKEISNIFARLRALGPMITKAMSGPTQALSRLLSSSNIISRSFSVLPGLFAKVGAVGSVLSKTMSSIGRTFSWLVNAASRLTIPGKIISQSIAGAGTAMTSLPALLSSKVAGVATRLLGTLKFLPLIGTALGFYQSYLRFSRGEIFLGGLELAAAIASMLPGPGTAIAIGLNVLTALLDSGSTGIGGATTLVLKGVANAGAKLIPLLSKTILAGAIKPLSLVLKRIPILGSILSFGMSISDFMNGNNLSGALNLLSGLGGLVDLVLPGVGTAIALAIDALNFFFTSTETGQGVAASIGNFFSNIGQTISSFFTSIFGWVAEAGRKTIGAIVGAFNWVKTFINDNIIGPVSDFASSVYDSTIGFFIDSFSSFSIDEMWTTVTSEISGIIDSVTGFISNTYSSMVSWLKDQFSAISDFFGSIKQFFVDAFNSAITGIANGIDFIGELFDSPDLSGFVSDFLTTVKDMFMNLWGEAKNIVKNGMDFLTGGVKNIISGIGSTISGTVSSVLDFFGSDDEEGESADTNTEKAPVIKDARVPAPQPINQQLSEPSTQLANQHPSELPEPPVAPVPEVVALANKELPAINVDKSTVANINAIDSLTSGNINQLRVIADSILAVLLNRPVNTAPAITTNIISGSTLSSKTSSPISDPRTIYSNR